MTPKSAVVAIGGGVDSVTEKSKVGAGTLTVATTLRKARKIHHIITLSHTIMPNVTIMPTIILQHPHAFPCA